jgi:hypothetical protein
MLVVLALGKFWVLTSYENLLVILNYHYFYHSTDLINDDFPLIENLFSAVANRAQIKFVGNYTVVITLISLFWSCLISFVFLAINKSQISIIGNSSICLFLLRRMQDSHVRGRLRPLKRFKDLIRG